MKTLARLVSLRRVVAISTVFFAVMVVLCVLGHTITISLVLITNVLFIQEWWLWILHEERRRVRNLRRRMSILHLTASLTAQYAVDDFVARTKGAA